ncbi:MAG: potassium-transporting ATPase subunit KdpA [Verrucomicrobiota bacterium]
MAIVGNLAKQKMVEASVGTLPTHGWTIGPSLLEVISIVAALTFFPVLRLRACFNHLIPLPLFVAEGEMSRLEFA